MTNEEQTALKQLIELVSEQVTGLELAYELAAGKKNPRPINFLLLAQSLQALGGDELIDFWCAKEQETQKQWKMGIMLCDQARLGLRCCCL